MQHSVPLHSTGNVMCDVDWFRPPHDFISHREHFTSGASFPPDFVSLLRLCLFHYFSLIVVLLLWMSRLRIVMVSFFVCFQKWNMSTGCFILKINQILHAVPVPDSMCSVQLDVASVTNRLGAYSPQSRVESRLWDASETRCGMTASKTDLS